MKRNPFLALALALAFSWAATAQDGINAPYSQYGFGLGHLPFNMPAVAAMGGTTITHAGNNVVNPFNPASYAAVEKESFVFDMGFGFNMVGLKDPSTSYFDADGSLAYLAVAFPITKWWKTSLSLMPMSEMNYTSTRLDSLSDPQGGAVRTIYDGSGGVNRLTWGHAFNLIPDRLSVGFNANYYQGYLSRDMQYLFTAPDSVEQYANVIRQRVTYIHNFAFDFGLQYQQPLGKDYRLDAGLTLSSPRPWEVTDNAMVRTFALLQGTLIYHDTIFPGPGENTEYQSTMELPSQVGLGLALQKNDAWRIALDAVYAPWSGVKYEDRYDLFGTTAVAYDDNVRTYLGFQLLGDPNANHYAQRITYSAGLHYEQGRLNLVLPGSSEVHTLNEWGFGLGAALPMRKGRSRLTLSASYSSMGSTDLLRHNCFRIGLSVSSAESWFVKKKYN